jgi:hypothetical protein
MQHTPILRAGTRTESIAAFPPHDTANAAEALSEPLSGFDAAAWLASFEAVGGGWIVRDCLSLAIMVEGRTDAELNAARQLVVDLAPEDRAAIVAFLKDKEARHGE